MPSGQHKKSTRCVSQRAMPLSLNLNGAGFARKIPAIPNVMPHLPRRGHLIVVGLGAVISLAAVAPSARQWGWQRWPDWLRPCAIQDVAPPVRCGTVRVFESGAWFGHRTIPVRVIVVEAQASRPSPDPVLLLVGGPGQAATELIASFTPQIAWLRSDRDVVLIDQRGTGQESGLHCSPPSLPADLMGRIFDPGRLAACRDALRQRADLTRYTTADAAGDYIRILRSLKYSRVNAWGTSYGTRLSLEIARQAPDLVRALVLDAVVPTFFTWPESAATDLDAGLNALLADCESDPPCADAFPQLRHEIDVAFSRLRSVPATASIRDPATGAVAQVSFGPTDLAYSVRGLLYGDARQLPWLFRLAADGDYDAFAQAYVARARALDRQIARGVHLGVYCAEDLPFVDRSRAIAAASRSTIGTYLLDQYAAACDVWPHAPIAIGFRNAVSSSVPALLLSGGHDPVTPSRLADEVSRTMPNSRALIWRYGGHASDGLVSGSCRMQIIRDFITTADARSVAVDCMTRVPAVPFQLGR